MSFDYVIVQAGGRGSRMGSLTDNKPKALIPVDNLPIIFHLFKNYPDKNFIIIGDYRFDVLKKYLSAFSKVNFSLVDASGSKGTCSGIGEALSFVPQGKSFMLIWCDLILNEGIQIDCSEENIIGISDSFPCRWKYEEGKFHETPGSEHGVAGLFVFKSRDCLKDVPNEGEFVRWLSSKDFVFKEVVLKNSCEYGTASTLQNQLKRCRPFNRITFEQDIVYKKPLDSQGEELNKRETAWYKKVRCLGFKYIPDIYEYNPLTMEHISGKNIYEYSESSIEEKKEILKSIVVCLKRLHSLEGVEADCDSYYEAYFGKTYKRLEKIRELVPFAADKTVRINGRECRNIFYNQAEFEEKLMKYMPKEFRLIHGDCTFSNIMLRDDNSPVLIDPRGYFGYTEIYGDEAYDWAKLYYSVFSNYDQFNLKKFSLKINERDVELVIDSNKWEELEEFFFDLIRENVTKKQLKLILSLIWLSLTTYAWEDYDSICAAFYNGLYYLEEVL